jgi:deoxyadenosine/deoxycytidine kinase/ribonuclease HI
MNHTTATIQTNTPIVEFTSFRPIILSIDGNIGSGKSTLYKDLQSHYKNNADICFVHEPVDDWTKIVDAENTPILTNLYKNTKKYAFRFQMMAYISRLHLLRQKVKENKYRIIISERSVQTDRNIFAKMLFDDGMIEHDEYQIYNQWFDEFLDDMYLGGIIYVKADPDICAERVTLRAREGETIPIEYLQKCHIYHENWLETNTDKLVIEANVDTRTKENTGIRQQWVESVDNWIHTKFSNNVSNSTYLPVLLFDGACRGNPSDVLGLGCLIKNSTKTETIEERSYRFPTVRGTNNEAEYMALIKGMKLSLECNIKSIRIEGDSILILNQMKGIYQVKAENLIPLYKTAKILEEQFDFIEYHHVKREFNKEADKLANQALDKDVTTCPGCHPRFQENQMAHIGPNGCYEGECGF